MTKEEQWEKIISASWEKRMKIADAIEPYMEIERRVLTCGYEAHIMDYCKHQMGCNVVTWVMEHRKRKQRLQDEIDFYDRAMLGRISGANPLLWKLAN